MKKLFYALVLFCIPALLFSQGPVWEKKFISPAISYDMPSHKPDASGYIHLSTISTSTGLRYHVMRTDTFGQLLWSKDFSSSGNALFCNAIATAPAGGYFFGGISRVPTLQHKYELQRIDANGGLTWGKHLSCAVPGFRVSAAFTFSVPTADNGFAMSGDLLDTSNMMYAYHLLKVDSAGNVVWSNRYHIYSSKTYHRSLDKCANEDLVITGAWRDTIQNGYLFPVLVRAASNGSQVWAKRYYCTDGSEYEPWQGITTADHGFAVTGVQYNPAIGKYSAYLAKFDSLGNFQWGKVYTDPLYQVFGWRVASLQNGNFAVCATTSDTSTVLIVTDPSGQMLWTKKYAVIGFDVDLQLTANGFSMLGRNLSYNRLTHVLTDTSGESGCDHLVFLQQAAFSFAAFPVGPPQPFPLLASSMNNETAAPTVTIVNACGETGQHEEQVEISVDVFPVPATSSLHVKCAEKIERSTLHSLSGQLVHDSQPQASSFVMNVSGLAAGVYLLRMETASGMTVRRVVIGE